MKYWIFKIMKYFHLRSWNEEALAQDELFVARTSYRDLINLYETLYKLIIQKENNNTIEIHLRILFIPINSVNDMKQFNLWI